jgi:hypothetical protein
LLLVLWFSGAFAAGMLLGQELSLISLLSTLLFWPISDNIFTIDRTTHGKKTRQIFKPSLFLTCKK